MTAALPKPSDNHSPFSRAIAHWRGETAGGADFAADDRGYDDQPAPRTIMRYAVAAFLALGVGATAASLATAPALTDSLDTVAALDARAIGLDANIDPNGQQKKTATLNRDVGAMKTEITRLQRALDQARSTQSAQTKAAAGNQDEVRALKGEIASLQKTLESTRDASASKIEQLTARVDQSKEDAAKLAEMRERLDRVERTATAERTASAERAPEPRREAARAADDEIKTGSIDQRDKASGPAAQIVRNWTVREVVRGVALLEGRAGMIEVVRGARAPGMGRIRSIERRDGQWVVVTDRGLVLERTEL